MAFRSMRRQLLLLIVAIMAFRAIFTSASARYTLAEITSIVSEAETMQNTNLILYFRTMAGATQVLDRLTVTNDTARLELARIARDALSMKSPTNAAVAQVLIEAKLSIAQSVDCNLVANLSDAWLLAKSLNEVRSILNTNYKTDPRLTWCVEPPIWSTNAGKINFRFPGMDPNLITNPQVRTEYEKAIALNSEKMAEANLQKTVLPRVNASLTELFVNYLKRLLGHDADVADQLLKLAKAARLTTEEEDLIKSNTAIVSHRWFVEHVAH